jgi:hypothetical protein
MFQNLMMAPFHKEAILGDDDSGGWKKLTIRNGKRDQFEPDTWIEIKSTDQSWSCFAYLVAVDFYTYSTLPKQDYLDDGFKSWEDMFEGMKLYYPDIKPDDEVTVIRWDDIMNA